MKPTNTVLFASIEPLTRHSDKGLSRYEKNTGHFSHPRLENSKLERSHVGIEEIFVRLAFCENNASELF